MNRLPVCGALLAAVGVAVLCPRGTSTPLAQSRPSVFIVAVKDSRMLTMCGDVPEVKFQSGGGWKPDGQVITQRQPTAEDLQVVTILPRQRPVESQQQARFDANPRMHRETAGATVLLPVPAAAAGTGRTTEGSFVERIALGTDRLAVDQAVEDAIEKEFVRQDRFSVVDSANKANFVFLAEASYFAQAVARSGNTTTIEYGDWIPNLRQSVLAIMVPAPVYLRGPGDIATLVANRMWEGSAVYQAPYSYSWTDVVSGDVYVDELKSYESASPESVVRQLHGSEPRMPSHPVLCAASEHVFIPPGARPRPAAALPASATTAVDVAAAKTPGERPLPATTFRSSVTYVPVPVLVTDDAGHDVSNLASSEFRLWEDGVEQNVDRVIAVAEPFNIALLIDSSTSMRSKVAEIQEAALGFVDALRPADRLMIVSFDRRIFVQASLTTDRDRLRRGVFQVSKDRGTRLYDAIALAAEQPSFATGNRKAMVLLTDGLDTESRLADAASTLAEATQYDGPIYAIQYDTTDDNRPVAMKSVGRDDVVPFGAGGTHALFARATDFLQRLAVTAGGRFYRASALVNMSEAFSQIATDLGGQYTLCYYPLRQAPDGTFHRIRVEVKRPGVTVRARAGYRAPGPGRQ